MVCGYGSSTQMISPWELNLYFVLASSRGDTNQGRPPIGRLHRFEAGCSGDEQAGCQGIGICVALFIRTVSDKRSPAGDPDLGSITWP